MEVETDGGCEKGWLEKGCVENGVGEGGREGNSRGRVGIGG